jgi:hypothetical protein
LGRRVAVFVISFELHSSKERVKAEFTSLMADKYEEYDQIYTDGSLKDDKVGFAIVTNNQIMKKG